MNKSKLLIASAVIFFALCFDQILKFWVKLNMFIGEEIHMMGDWAILHFTENPGMAFGMEFGGIWGKIALSLFRLVAICGIGYFIVKLIKEHAKTGLIIAVSLILAGAIGNMIDSAIYGLIFSESGNFHGRDLATIFPEGGGYGTALTGSVVDMLYFPILDFYKPEWLPEFMGPGERFIFFSPVFNIADACISVGVFQILIFQRRYFVSGLSLKTENLSSDGDEEEEDDAVEIEESTEPIAH